MAKFKSLVFLAKKYPKYSDIFEKVDVDSYYLIPTDIADAVTKARPNITSVEWFELSCELACILHENMVYFWMVKNQQTGEIHNTLYKSIYDIPSAINDSYLCIPVLVENY